MRGVWSLRLLRILIKLAAYGLLSANCSEDVQKWKSGESLKAGWRRKVNAMRYESEREGSFEEDMLLLMENTYQSRLLFIEANGFAATLLIGH